MTLFFDGRQKEVQLMKKIADALVKADDQQCVTFYIDFRKKAVASLVQTAGATGGEAVPAAAKQQKQMREYASLPKSQLSSRRDAELEKIKMDFRWSHQVRMLNQAMQWEIQLAYTILPSSVCSKAIEAIISPCAKSTIDTGYSLAAGRTSPERLLLLLDAIACLCDQAVLQLMKKVFKESALKAVKHSFHDLLSYLYEQAQNCVESFTASLPNSIQLNREIPRMISVAQQTAFVVRILKSLFRSELQDKLPFLTNPQKLAKDVISTLLNTVEQRIQMITRDPAVVNVAMMNNLRYVLVGVAEHERLLTLLGTQWHDSMSRRMSSMKKEYWGSTWESTKEMIQVALREARPDAKKDTVKEHCKKINMRLEKNWSVQAEWTIPDPGLKNEILNQIKSDVVVPYGKFWNIYTSMQLLQNPQKHFKYSPQEVSNLMTGTLFSGVPIKPGTIKK